MQATSNQVFELLGSPTQFYIPIFQRAYSWEKKHCVRLLEDIINISQSEERKAHFIGSIIYLRDNALVSQVSRCALIDGQQRLTTLSLILIALADYSKYYYRLNNREIPPSLSWDAIKSRYIIHLYIDGDEKYKLKLSGSDFEVYKSLVIDRDNGNNYSNHRLVQNYNEIISRMKKGIVNPETIINGIGKLLLVNIALETNDNAQAVFETVNSTGKKLENYEKIKNYILMTVPVCDQNNLFINYWQKIESAFIDESGKVSNEFDSFLRYYLIVKEKKKIGSDYYDDFKKYCINSESTSQVVKELKKYLSYYDNWRKGFFNGNDNLSDLLQKVKYSNQDRLTPVILKLMADSENGNCSAKNAEDLIGFIESYLIRRKICGVPDNSMSEVCISILKKIEESGYDQIIENCISHFTPAQRFPNDDEIKYALQTRQMYSINRVFTEYILERIEQSFNSEFTHSSNLSVEHIMPQSLSNDWKADLGENWFSIHEKYIHTLGNLTLTGYNSVYSNRRFLEKKCMENGFAQSTLRLNSEFVAKQEKWGEEEIKMHTEWLFEIIKTIWKNPSSEPKRYKIEI